MDSDSTQYYGLLGRKLGHSFSRSYFMRKFADEVIDAEYLNFEIDSIDSLPEILSSYPGLRGLNVTIPYKEEVMRFADRLTPEAMAIGAVNTLRVERSASGSLSITGHNTDAEGFACGLRPLLRPDIRRALVLGSGGASKAVVYALRRLGIEPHVVSRNLATGRYSYPMLSPEVMASHLLIVNTTPLGMWPDVDSCPAIPYNLITPHHICYDLVYNPDPTRFMTLAEEHGATVTGGLVMLHAQAEASWLFWQGVAPLDTPGVGDVGQI